MRALSRCRILRHLGDGLLDPFAAAQALLRLPVCSLVPVARLRQSKERVEKCAGVAQQHLVRRSIEFRFFGRTVDADQLTRCRKERRIAEIHLIIQTAAYHDRQIRLLQCVS